MTMTVFARHSFHVAAVILTAVSMMSLPSLVRSQNQTAPSELPAPPLSDLQPFIGPEILTDELPNGLRIVYARVNEVPLVEISVVFGAGLNRDPAGRHGLGQLTARALFRGTASRTQQNIIDELAGLGSTITSSSSYEFSQLYARMLSRNARQTVEILADLCMNATFSGPPISSEADAIRRGASMYQQSTAELATRETLASLFGDGHPMTRSLLDAPEDLAAITVDDVVSHYRTFYRPGNATAIVTGNIDFQTVRDILADRFGKWEPGPQPGPDTLGAAGADRHPVVVLEDPSLKSAVLRIGMHAPGRRSEDFYPLVILSQILGGEGRSILGQRMGLKTVLGNSSRQGYIMYSGSMKPEIIDTAIGYLGTIERWIAEQGPSGEMVEFAKKQLLAGFTRGFVSNKMVQEKLQQLAAFGLPATEMIRQWDAIESVTKEQVKRVASDLFADQSRVIVIAGNSEVLLPNLQARFGKSVTLRRPAIPLTPDSPPPQQE